jgi:hypothetical protein
LQPHNNTPQEAVAVACPHRRKRIQAGQAGCIKTNRRLAARGLRKEFSSKIVHLKSTRRRVDDACDLLCNIRSSIGARTNDDATMVTVEPQPNPRVANADTVDRADVPAMPALAAGGALAAKDQRKPGKLTTPTRRKTCGDGSAPILLHGHLREHCA